MPAVLEYYTIFEKEERLSVWKIRSSEISGRGAATKNFKKRKIQEDKNAKVSVTQSLLTAECERKEEVSAHSAKAKENTQKVRWEFIALDDQPFSVVEDVEFWNSPVALYPVTVTLRTSTMLELMSQPWASCW